MNTLRSYIRPRASSVIAPPAPAIPMTSAATRSSGPSSRNSTSGFGTPRSMHPAGDFRNNAQEQIDEIKSDIAINWVYNLQNKRMWNGHGAAEGVVLRKGPKTFMSCPAELSLETGGLFDAACELDTRVLMTVNTRVIHLILQRQDLVHIDLREGLRVQILPNIMCLANGQRHQNAAFIKDQAILVVWADSPQEIISRAEYIEAQMMEIFARGLDPYDEKSAQGISQIFVTELPAGAEPPEAAIPREDGLPEGPRKIMLNQAVLTAITLLLIVAALGTGWRQMAIETAVDHSYLRMAFFIVVPLQVWLALFFMQSVAGSCAQLFGPSRQMNQNSKYFSGIAPARILRGDLPHVTIQCPVYKEGLYSVIDPTVKSLKAAISTYEMQGGKANIFINDDGMQLISPEDAAERRKYYEEQRIGWVARPKHNPKPADGAEPFIRPGKFKKASNMNYAMAVSARVEDKLVTLQRGEKWNQEAEFQAFNRCLEEVKMEDNGRTWAEGNIRLGDYILLIDSDTRVPQDCFLDAVSEMEASPQVAILQYSSGVMNVTTSFFEMGITFFTNLIYTAIRYAVANGDVAPFVGHNAILRWKAVQDISYEEDGVEKYWSECTVSEDFDMALRLQCEGYIVRLGAYTKMGFKEGVSLTVYDELSRWEKYAYGCNELIFHPIKYWIFRGPFTPLFKKFIGSNMPLASKITIMAYVGTYYAIGSAWLLTLANYFLVGWYNGHLDHYYVDSFKIYFAIVLVFNTLGNIALAVLRYRLDEQDIIAGLITNFKWILLLTIFLGGISLHVSQALLSHMFSIDMSWGATAKEVVNTSFFEEIPKLIKKFKITFIWCFACAAGMIYLAVGRDDSWRINFFTAIWPLSTIVVSHFLLPIVLNPSLMLFTW